MGDIADYYSSNQYFDESLDRLKKVKPLLHKCKDGRIVDIRGISDKYPKMDDQHLLNTINYIKRRAKEGVMVREGGGSDADSFWYDEDVLFGKEVKKYLQYKKYKKEAIKRGIL